MFISNIPKMGFNLNEVPKELRDSALEARGDRGTGAPVISEAGFWFRDVIPDAPASRRDLRSGNPASRCDIGSGVLVSRRDPRSSGLET